MSDNEEDPRERLKAAIWYTVGEICERERITLNVVITPQLVASLADLVFAQAETLGKDLETFSKHAKRSTVNADDVKHEIITREAERLSRRNKGVRDAKKKKK
ncbi:kinetochore component CENP-S-domain-containing protein [Gamsiella multidivaricata]|uniref:kinetochore component CENP-S-domain-containing protein n=1 Tax=Gamsiella multidivaricata TaxID=101098 RepID=UPI002220C664|nr:kinetochore component CENP-S-domain-containing protein [Gamsiella multidivaricata]KAI7827612.1 kinetochore component CENP-S-domain-containing protein [Gamsiella multidivaricata]